MGAGAIVASLFKPTAIEWPSGEREVFASIRREVQWESLAVEGGLIEFPEPTATPGAAGLRLALGTIMIAHGWQKIADHLQGITGVVHHMGLPTFMAYLVVAAEFVGGILLVIGFLTRLAALAILVDMLVAIFKVHLPHGLFASNGGFEFPMACAAIAFALIFTGAGPIAIDWLWEVKEDELKPEDANGGLQEAPGGQRSVLHSHRRID